MAEITKTGFTDADNRSIKTALIETDKLGSLIATDKDSAEAVNVALKKLSSLRRKLEDRRKEIGDPHRKLVNDINARYKPVTNQIDANVRKLKQTAANYLLELRQKEIEEQRQREALEQAKEEAATEQEADAIDMAMQMSAPETDKTPASMGTSTRTHYEVSDIDIRAICEAVTKGAIPEDAVVIKSSVLQDHGKALLERSGKDELQLNGFKIRKVIRIAA